MRQKESGLGWTCLQCGRVYNKKDPDVKYGRHKFCSLACKRAHWEDSFWARGKKIGNGCWEWAGYRYQNGYGKAQLTRNGIKLQYAHRVAYFLVNGPIPEGKFVCHHCDNPPCINPAHLFLGTNKSNSDDKMRKGRANPPCLKGESCGAAKLTEQQVREIRHKHKKGYSGRGLAREYKISQSQISNIVLGYDWAHLLN